MINAESNIPKQKHIYFKTYDHISLLEKDLKYVKEKNSTGHQISIIGNVVQFYHDKNLNISKDTDSLKTYWKNTFDNAIAFGTLNNPEIGNIFIVGALSTTFFHKVGGKTLGAISVGPYGILRGIGASEAQSTNSLKLLKSGSYLIIFRGFEEELKDYKILLDEEENG